MLLLLVACLLLSPLPPSLSSGLSLVSAQPPSASNSPRDRLAALHKQREAQKRIKQQEREEFVRRQQEEQDRIHKERQTQHDIMQQEQQQQRQHELEEQPVVVEQAVAAAGDVGLEQQTIANATSAAPTEPHSNHSQHSPVLSTDDALNDDTLQQPPTDSAEQSQQEQQHANETAQPVEQQQQQEGRDTVVHDVEWRREEAELSNQQLGSANDTPIAAALDETEPPDTNTPVEGPQTTVEHSRGGIEQRHQLSEQEQSTDTAVSDVAQAGMATTEGDEVAASQQQQAQQQAQQQPDIQAEHVSVEEFDLSHDQYELSHAQQQQHEHQTAPLAAFDHINQQPTETPAISAAHSDGTAAPRTTTPADEPEFQLSQPQPPENEAAVELPTASDRHAEQLLQPQLPSLSSSSPLPLQPPQPPSDTRGAAPPAPPLPSLPSRSSFSVSSVVRSLLDRVSSSAQSLASSIGRISSHTQQLHSRHTAQQERTDSSGRRKRAVRSEDQRGTKQPGEEEMQRPPFSAVRAEERARSRFQAQQQPQRGAQVAPDQQPLPLNTVERQQARQ